MDSTFTSNGVLNGFDGNTRVGGAIFATAVNPLLVTNCIFTGNFALGPNRKGAVMSLAGAGLSALIVDCVISNNATANSSDDIYIESTGTVMLERTIITGGVNNGINMVSAGMLSLTNCLVHSSTQHGISITAGSAAIASTTLADNGGWGLSFNGVNLDVENTIVWGNTGGGISATASGAEEINYTLSQEAHDGTSNQNGANPKFKATPDEYYALASGSPAINSGINRDWMNSGIDLARNRRQIGTVDRGAYESATLGGSLFMMR